MRNILLSLFSVQNRWIVLLSICVILSTYSPVDGALQPKPNPVDGANADPKNGGEGNPNLPQPNAQRDANNPGNPGSNQGDGGGVPPPANREPAPALGAFKKQAGAEQNKPVNNQPAPDPANVAKKLADSPECQDAISRYCPTVSRQNDIAVVQCLEERKEQEPLSHPCQDVLWEFKKSFTQDERFHNAALQFCDTEIKRFPDCSQEVNAQKGHFLSCLVDHKENMTDSRCIQFLTRIESIVFSDFRLVGPFIQACESEIKSLGCGRTDYYEDAAHSQAETIDCMLKFLVGGGGRPGAPGQGADTPKVTPMCRQQLLRIAELQADDFHLDKPLYYACRNDREYFCSNVQAGEGRVYACLIRFIQERKMSEHCREKLILRQQLAAQDYRVAHTLVKECANDINKYRCAPQSPQQGETPKHENFYLSYVLLCLENAIHQGNSVAGECQREMFEHRKALMSDYRLSPEIVYTCVNELQTFCSQVGPGPGKILQCLMHIVQSPEQQFRSVTDQCRQSVRALLKVADMGSDYRVDPILVGSCGSAIDQLCHDRKTSEAEVLSCLMDNVESKLITSECEKRLLEVQYFLSRDFALDPQLYQACRADAMKFCHAKDNWSDLGPDKQNKPEQGPLVLPCLYRRVYGIVDEGTPGSPTVQESLSAQCTAQVKRVMRERAVSVRLIPDVEEACMPDLADLCSKNTGLGEELECLQKNYDKLQEACKKKIGQFIQMESKDIRLNRALSHACRPVMERHCADVENTEIDSLDIVECLKKNKNQPEMSPKCLAYVQHYELVTQKDYNFSYKFKEACRSDIEANCRDKITQPNNKREIIQCLSQLVFEYKLLGGEGQAPQVSQACRRQMRKDYLEIRADALVLDPDMSRYCSDDLAKFCAETQTPMECLREHRGQLMPKCLQYVFQHEGIQAADNEMDIVLQKACKADIEKYCSQVPLSQSLHCLKETKLRGDGMLTSKCSKVVQTRMQEQAGDIRLQPSLRKACQEDIKKYCNNEMKEIQQKAKGVDAATAKDKVVSCLRKQFAKHREHYLTSECRTEVKRIVMESELDPRLDPPFYDACKDEINRMCSESVMEMGHQHALVMECMKSKLYEYKLKDPKCIEEMQRRTDEELADIHVDPGLFEACVTEVQRYCREIPAGGGRQISCLISASQSSNTIISDSCRGKLEERKKLWGLVFKDKLPENFADFAEILQVSPYRNTLLTLAGVILAVVLLAGICCGRVTKRLRRELKNK